MTNNTYTLRTEEIEGIVHFYVCFNDGQELREIEVSRPVYLEFLRSVKKEHNQSRWNRRYIEQSELTDQALYARALYKPKSVEDTVLDNLRDERLARTVAELPEKQQRRFLLHYEFGLTFQQIAEMEGHRKQSIHDSVKCAEEKIRKNFKNDMTNRL